MTLPAPRAGMGRGVVWSLALHVVVALLLIFVLPRAVPPPPVEEAIAVELVQPGEETASPQPQRQAEPPRQTAPPSARQDHLTAAPKVAAAPTPVRPPAASRRPRNAGPKAASSDAEDFDARLRAAERDQQRASVMGAPQSRSGHGTADAMVDSHAGKFGPRASYSVKDIPRLCQVPKRRLRVDS